MVDAHRVSAVAEALDYAHQRELLHRDVKPSNILLAQSNSTDIQPRPAGGLRDRTLGAGLVQV